MPRETTNRQSAMLSGPASLLDNASRFYGLSLVIKHAIRFCRIFRLLKKDDALVDSESIDICVCVVDDACWFSNPKYCIAIRCNNRRISFESRSPGNAFFMQTIISIVCDRIEKIKLGCFQCL